MLAAGAAGGAMLLAGGLSTAFSGSAASASPAKHEVGPNRARETVADIVPPPRIALPRPASAATPTPGWQIQIGAYSSPTIARAQLRTAEAAVPELASLAEALQPWDDITRARFVGVADEAEARRLCGRVAEAGRRCFVVAPGG